MISEGTESAMGALLLSLARAAIREHFGAATLEQPEGEAWLSEKRAVFVTLTQEGELRGCVGQLVARLSLFEAIRDAARAAALEDPRFFPLQEDELPLTRVEVSVLSPLEPLEVRDEAELLAVVRPGVDGLVLKHQFRSGLFIPEMWKQLPEPHDFISQLKRKAGIPPGSWPPGTKVERFTAQHWEDPA